MSKENNRVAVTIWENKIKNPIMPLWNKVQIGFMGSRFDLNNLINEFKAIKDHINRDMNSKGLALRDVDVIIEFYPDFQSQAFELDRYLEKNLESGHLHDSSMRMDIQAITDTLVSDKSINISPKDALFLFGIASLTSNPTIGADEFIELIKPIYIDYKEKK